MNNIFWSIKKINLLSLNQLKDNIRTARQLGPTFFLHFINIMVSCEFPLVLYYGIISEEGTIKLFSLITQLAISFGNILIEFTIIRQWMAKLFLIHLHFYFQPPSNSSPKCHSTFLAIFNKILSTKLSHWYWGEFQEFK